jgi:hypothetical protein
VLDGIHYWKDLQQESLLARPPSEIFGNCLDEFLAPRAHGSEQGAQCADAPRRIWRLVCKRRALCGQRGHQLRFDDAGVGSARKCGL